MTPDSCFGKKIEEDPSFAKHLNQHQVIRIDVQNFLPREEELERFLPDLQEAVVSELQKAFPLCGIRKDMRLQRALNEIFADTEQRFIFIIDEWDCVFRMAKDHHKVQKDYLDFLRNLFKGTAYVELVYMTGILPIKKYGEHSAVNMFTEYSMTAPKDLSPYFGFTKEEVQQQCDARDIDFQEMQDWYDGYIVGGRHIYNPKSVNDALVWKTFHSYWTGTETYEALKIYIDLNFDGLREAIVEMLGGGTCIIDTTSFQNDMTTFRSKDDVLTLLVHLGYLTYDEETNRVNILNLEIKQEFLRAVQYGTRWDGLLQSLAQSGKLTRAPHEICRHRTKLAVSPNSASAEGSDFLLRPAGSNTANS